jgi:hypothetical protein
MDKIKAVAIVLTTISMLLALFVYFLLVRKYVSFEGYFDQNSLLIHDTQANKSSIDQVNTKQNSEVNEYPNEETWDYKNLSSFNNASETEKLSFKSSLGINIQKNIAIVKPPARNNGNYYLSFQNKPDLEFNAYEFNSLYRLKSLFDMIEANPSIDNHLSVTLRKGENLKLLGFHPDIKDRRISTVKLEEDISIEINRIMYDLSEKQVLFGITNAFNEQAYAPGDLSISLTIEHALNKLKQAKKGSSVVADFHFNAVYKHKNTHSAVMNTGALYPKVSGEVDIVKYIGFGMDEVIPYKYVMGKAVFGNEDINVMAGGACAGASFINAALESGMDAYNITYKKIVRNKHSDPKHRYKMSTTHPEALKDPERFDVTVYLMPNGNQATARYVIEEGIVMKVDIKKLLNQEIKSPGHSIYVINTYPIDF